VRSAAEIAFRLRQEAANAWAYLHPPQLPRGLPDRTGLDCLPNPAPVVEAIRGTPYSQELIRLAEEILVHKFSLLGYTIETGGEVAWRRDYVHDVESPLGYARRISDLGVERTGDLKIVWELNRHQHLVVLAQAWRLTRREEFVAEIRAQLESWTAQNPCGSGINWASALEVAFRALSWIWTYHLAGEALGAETRAHLREGLYRHGRHLERNLSVYYSPNTHLLGEALALFAIGRAFPDFPGAARWRECGVRWVEGQIDVQVRADGTYFEQSTYYHVYALDMLLFYAVLAKPGPAVLDRLRDMARYLWALLGPCGAIPFLGDDDGGRLFHPYGDRSRFGRATLAASAVLLDQDFPRSLEDVVPIAAWWVGPQAIERAQPGWRPWQGAELFRDAGVAIVSRGAAQTIVDTRAFGSGRAGHSHAHALTLVERSTEGEILIDPGTYAYAADAEWRNRFRGTSAHNTVRVDGLDQADPAGPFGWRNLPSTRVIEWRPDFLHAECRCRGIVHRRQIFWLPEGRWVVVDRVEGPPGEHVVEQFWHLAPEADRALLCFADPVDTEAGWASPVFGQKHAAPVLVVRRRGSLPMVMAAAFDPKGRCRKVFVRADALEIELTDTAKLLLPLRG
jgi:hypothetical protein